MTLHKSIQMTLFASGSFKLVRGCSLRLRFLLIIAGGISIGVIVSTATLLSLVLKRIRQPKVIAEVLGGIILGTWQYTVV